MTDTTTLLKATSPPEPAAQDLEIVPVRRYGRWIAAAASILALVGLIGSLAKNDNLHWDVVATYLFADLIFDGLATTLWLTAAAMALGLGLGTLVAVMRLSTSPVLHGLATAFVWVFRGTPLLVQIIFWGYAAALYKYVKIGVPFTDITFFQAETRLGYVPRGGFGFLRSGLVDTHTGAYGREGRALRLAADTHHDRVYALEENTALVVDDPGTTDERLSVLGPNGVAILDLRQARARTTAAG